MLTPQEISSKEFAKAVFGGYDMGAVDDFIEAVNKDYSDLYKENAVLKNKLKVLVEKIEEYRATEDAMRMALLTAQKMAKEITDEAEKKSRNMVGDAERATRDKIESFRAEAAAEAAKVETVRVQTAAYVTKVKELLVGQIAFLEKLDEVAAPPVSAAPAAPAAPAEPVQEPVEDKQSEQEKKAEEIEKSVAEIIENTMAAAEQTVQGEPEFTDADTKVFDPTEAAEARKTKFEFFDLQFGKDVDITK